MFDRKIENNNDQKNTIPTQNPVIEYVMLVNKAVVELQANSLKTTRFNDGLENVRAILKRLLAIITRALPAIENIKSTSAPVKLPVELAHRLQLAEKLSRQSEETLKSIQREYSNRKQLIALMQTELQKNANEIDHDSAIQHIRSLQQRYKALLTEMSLIKSQLASVVKSNNEFSFQSLFGSNRKNPTQLCYIESNLKKVEKEILMVEEELGDDITTDFYRENTILITECANQLIRVNKEYSAKIRAAEDELKLRETNLFKLYVESEKIKLQSICSIDRALMLLIVRINILLIAVDQAIDQAYQRYNGVNKTQSSRITTMFSSAEPNFATLIKISSDCKTQIQAMNSAIRCPESGNLTVAELIERYNSADVMTQIAFTNDHCADSVIEDIIPRVANESVTPLLSSERLLRRPSGI